MAGQTTALEVFEAQLATDEAVASLEGLHEGKHVERLGSVPQKLLVRLAVPKPVYLNHAQHYAFHKPKENVQTHKRSTSFRMGPMIRGFFTRLAWNSLVPHFGKPATKTLGRHATSYDIPSHSEKF